MKKATVGLIGIVLVIMLNSNAWAHPGLRIDLGGNGFGFSVNGYPGLSTFSYNNYQPYPYYSGYYPSRPYMGWGGYSGHHHHNKHRHWNHHRSGHHHNKHYYGQRRGHKQGGYGRHYRNNHRQGQRGGQWIR